MTKNGEHFSKTEKNVFSQRPTHLAKRAVNGKQMGREEKNKTKHLDKMKWVSTDDMKEGLGRISTVRETAREVLSDSMRKQLGRISETKRRQQISRYHTQNIVSNLEITARGDKQDLTDTGRAGGGVEPVPGNIVIDGRAVHKRPVERRRSSIVACNNNRCRGIPEHLDADERREQHK